MPPRRPGGRSAPRSAAAEQIDALSFSTLRSLAENAEASPQTLALLARDPLLDVRLAVAWNPRTPAAALARLAAGPVEVQTGVAQNPATPIGVLERLAGHAEPVVRSGAATNPGAPVPLLFALAHDPDARVRRHVARNPRAPRALLALLARDPDPEVRRAAGDGVGGSDEPLP